MKRYLFSQVCLCALFSVSQSLLAENGGSNSDFSIPEAKMILQIRAAEQQRGVDDVLRKRTCADVRLLSASNGMAFVSDVALDTLQRIDGDVSHVFVARDLVSLMASTVDRETKLNVLKNIQEHGARIYYATWLSFHDRNSSLSTSDLFQNRQAMIWKAYETINSGFRGKSVEERTSMLFGILKDWRTPFDYEAAMLMIMETYKTHPDKIVSMWTETIMNNVPATSPPLFTREHTQFYTLCVLGKSIGGPDVLATLAHLESSSNPYVAKNVRDALKWVRLGVPYPLEYRELRRAYHSRS